MSSNNVGHLITSTNTTLHHFDTLHHTSPNCTSLHLPTIHFLSFTLHYPPIWLNPFAFPTVLFQLTSLNKVQFSHLQTYFQNIEPIHSPKATLTISLHFAFYLFIYFSLILSTLHFTLLCFSYQQLTSLHFLLFIAFTFPQWFSLSQPSF